MGVTDRCLVSERTVMYWNPRSFKGYQRRKSFMWAYLFNVTLGGDTGDTTCLIVIHLLLFREVHVHYVWGISVMNRWIWCEFSNTNLRGSIFVQEEWCLWRRFAISSRIGRSAKMGGSLRWGKHLDRWWHASPSCSRNVLIKIGFPTLLNSI